MEKKIRVSKDCFIVYSSLSFLVLVLPFFFLLSVVLCEIAGDSLYISRNKYVQTILILLFFPAPCSSLTVFLYIVHHSVTMLQRRPCTLTEEEEEED